MRALFLRFLFCFKYGLRWNKAKFSRRSYFFTVYKLATAIICLWNSTKKETYYFVWNNTQLQYFFLKIVDFSAWLSVWMPSQWTRMKIYRFNEINTNSLDKCSNNIQCWRFLLKFCWRCLHFHQYTHCICFNINQTLSL